MAALCAECAQRVNYAHGLCKPCDVHGESVIEL